MAKTLKDKMQENKNKGITTRKDRMKKYFDKYLWSENMLRVAVRKGELSVADFTEITNATY